MSALLHGSGTNVSVADGTLCICELDSLRGDVVLASDDPVVVVASLLLLVDVDDWDADWLECDGVSRTTKSSPTFDNSDDDDESWLLLNIVSRIRPTIHQNSRINIGSEIKSNEKLKKNPN